MPNRAKPLPDRVHLILNYRPLGLVRATAVTLQEKEMVVDTGCILLPPHAEVEVTCSYCANGQNHVHRLSAEVISVNAGETRLRLIATENEVGKVMRCVAERLKPARALASLARALPGSLAPRTPATP